MASYSYSSLEVAVTANTREMSQKIERDATQAGSRAGEQISKGMSRVGPAALAVGKAAAAGIGLATAAAVTFGIKAYKAAEEANKVTKQTAAVIKSTGGAAHVTAKQVQQYANALMAKTGIDDEAIKSGENMLLTFRNIRNEAGKGNDIFRQATTVVTDMTAALNNGQVTQENVRKQSIMLGKALNDPVRGITALTRVGVTFNDQQRQQITTLAESGHRLEAQKIILRELNTEFGGSAVAAATFSQRLKTAWGEIQEAVGGAVAEAVNPALAKIGALASRFSAAIGPGGKLAPIFHAIGVAIGGVIAPLSKLIDLTSRWLANVKPSTIDKVASAIERFGPALAAVGAATAAVGAGGLLTQLPIIGPMLSSIVGPLTSVVSAMGGLGGALKFLTGPVGIIITLIGLMLAVSPQFRSAVMGLATSLITALMPAFNAIVAALKPLMPLIALVGRLLGSVLAPIITALTPLLVSLAQVLTPLAQLVAQLVRVVMLLVTPVLKVYIAFQKWYTAKLLLPLISLLAKGISYLVGWITTLVKWILGGSPGLVPALQLLAKVALTVIRLVAGLFVNYFRIIKTVVVSTFKVLTTVTRGAFQVIAAIVRGALQVINAVIHGRMGDIRAIIAQTWARVRQIIGSTITQVAHIILSGFNQVKTIVVNAARAMLNTVRGLASGFLNAGKNAIHNLLAGITGALRGIGSWVKAHIVNPIVNAVKHFFGIHSPSTVMEGIGSNLVKGLFNGMVPGISGIGDMVHMVFGSFPGALAAMIGHGLIGIASLPGKALNALMSLFSGDAGGLVNLARKYGGHRYVWGGGANATTGFDCSSFVNMLSGMLHLRLPGGFHAPSFAHGPTTLGWLGSGMAHVGYGNMRPNDLYVSSEHMGVVTGRNTGFAARSTATGTGPQTIGPGYNILRFPGGMHLPSWLQGLMGKIGGFFSKLFGGGPSGGEGQFGGATRWSGLMRQVLAMVGRPDLFAIFMRQMQSESGGNPNVVNRWDSNWRAGIPSQGLMQVIPPTFAQYAGKFRKLGILNPLANIYAAVRYALARYGRNIAAVLGHGHGYAGGGVISERVTGIGHRTGRAYFFGERGPELVSPLTGPGMGTAPAGGRAIVVNVYPQQGQSETEIAAAVSRQLAWAVSTGRA